MFLKGEKEALKAEAKPMEPKEEQQDSKVEASQKIVAFDVLAGLSISELVDGELA